MKSIGALHMGLFFKKFLVFGLVAAFAVGCSKKTKEDPSASSALAGGDSAQISNEQLSFNPAGSDSGSISGLRTVNFPYDSSTISAEARQILNDNASWIKQNKSLTIQIEGHCDSRGSVEYNLALGERRAKAVKDYLVGLGVEGKRMTIISYGKEKPIDMADSEEAMGRNRRANFLPLSN